MFYCNNLFWFLSCLYLVSMYLHINIYVYIIFFCLKSTSYISYAHTKKNSVFFWWFEILCVVWNMNKLILRGNEASRFDRPGGGHSSDKYILNVCKIDTTNFLFFLPHDPTPCCLLLSVRFFLKICVVWNKNKLIFKVGLCIFRTNADSQWNPVYNVFHRIFVVEMKWFVCSTVNVILTRQTCGQRSSRAAESKRRALDIYFSSEFAVCSNCHNVEETEI